MKSNKKNKYILDNNMRIFSGELLILGNKMLEYVCTDFIFHTFGFMNFGPNLYHGKLQTNLRTWIMHIPREM